MKHSIQIIGKAKNLFTPRKVGGILLAMLFVFVAVVYNLPAKAQAQNNSMDEDDMQNMHQTMQMGNQGANTFKTGFTDGWFQGRTVTFFYHNKNFFCKTPPASGAKSNCEAGADAQSMPNQKDIPPLYVMTPLGFTPSGLQCPTAGNCINHPHTIDLSAVLGKGTENALLPAHSHIIDDADPGWWKVVVIGVKSQGDWNKIAAGKDLATVRSLQQSDPANVTADIPTNTFLFFDVLSHGKYAVVGSQLINYGQ